MTRRDVVVVGSVNADFVLTVDHRPAPGETIAASTCATLPGGKGANQAVAAARCGARVGLVAKVGRDPLGAERLQQLRREGVDVTHTTEADAPTGLAFVSVSPDGENTIVIAPGANAALGIADVETARDALQSASVVVCQLEIPTAAVRRAAALASGRATVVLNAAPFRELDPELLGLVDVLVVNRGEGDALVGDGTFGDDVEVLAHRLEQLGPSAVVVTLGGEGAVFRAGGDAVHLPAPKMPVVDTTGAGDAFVGALAAALAGGASLRSAVAAGITAGSATVAHAGASPQIPASLRNGRERLP